MNQVRALQSFVFDQGYYLSLDARHEWQTEGLDLHRTAAEFEVGRQFSPALAGSMRLGRSWGDQSHAGSIELNVRTFF